MLRACLAHCPDGRLLDFTKHSTKSIWWPQGAAIAGPFPVRLPLAGRLELKAA